jgi:cobalt-zinc-cadmium efflux system protein
MTINNNQKSLIAALLITALIFFAELIGGFLSNSLALVSDAGHMLTDTMALALALLAAFFAARPATKERTFGFYRLEILSSLFNGSVLTLVAFYIFYQAYQRFLHPSEVWSGLMLTIATIGLAANIGAAVILAGSSRENLNVRGAFLHVLSDMVSSVGVIIGGLIIQLTRWYYIDPILGVMIGILILRGALSLVVESANILLEAAPAGIDTDEVTRTICAIDGVEDIHDLHIWSISSGVNAISAHIVIEEGAVEKTSGILKNIRQELRTKFNITHATFQTECEACPEDLFCHIEPAEKEGHKH